MNLTALFFICGIGASVSLAASDGPLAFLKGSSELYVTDANAENPRRLDHDARGKWMLRWDAYRGTISYLVPRAHGESGEMAIIVELDASGNVVLEAPIPHDDEMRFVEDFEWLPNGNARLGGSVNPRNCVLMDLEPQTGKVTNGRDGKCSSFVRSPDDKHTVELGVIPQTDDDHRFDSVDFDSPRIFSQRPTEAAPMTFSFRLDPCGLPTVSRSLSLKGVPSPEKVRSYF